MQVGASEFIAVIVGLLTLLGGCIIYAMDALDKRRKSESALEDAQKKIFILTAEIARLQKIVDSQKPAHSDEFTKPLNYPGLNLS